MKIDELIYLQNPWLRDALYVPREDKLEKRDIFHSLLEDVIKTKQVISLTGLRRTGKSTLLKQIIALLLKNSNISRSNIFYFSFDQPTVEGKTNTLESIIDFYFNNILNYEISKLDKKVYLFFDEIQLIPFWQDIVKRFYDINSQIKFVVTGSASIFITDKSKESLAGRIFEKYLPPLSFSEYKKLSGKTDFVEFLDFGQFPELLELKDNEKKIEYLKEGVIGKVLNIDIVKSYGVKKVFDFERLFWSLLSNCGQIIESRRLMSDLSLKKATLFKYLAILEKSLLVNKVLNLSGSFRSEKRLLRKLYPASSNFLTLTPETVSTGLKAEAYITSLLKEKVRDIYLYNVRGKEIDFVAPDKKIAIEVKYQENIHYEDYQFLDKFIREKNYLGIVVTKKYQGQTSNLSFVPAEEFAEFLKTKQMK